MAKRPDFKGFTQWLCGRGRTEQTAALYVRNIGYCMKDRRGLVARVAQDGLAPKTRRTHKAALAAWADYNEDEVLRRRLRDIKLPPPERLTEKRALEEDNWRAVLQALDTFDEHDPIVSAIGLVCHRGFRIGDVCRLRHSEVKGGLSSGILNYLSKGGRRVRWTVTDQLAVYLSTFMENTGWTNVWDLMAPEGSTELRWRAARLNASRAFPGVVAAGGVEPQGVTRHIMRRTYAWHFLQHAGRDPVALQKHMGWASINTAMEYVDQSERSTQDAVAATMAASVRGN